MYFVYIFFQQAAIKKDEKIVHAAPTPEGVAFTGMFAPPPVMTEPIKLD